MTDCCYFAWEFRPPPERAMTTRLFQSSGSPPAEGWRADELNAPKPSIPSTIRFVNALAIHPTGDVIVTSTANRIRRRSVGDGSVVWDIPGNSIINGLVCDSSGDVYLVDPAAPFSVTKRSGADGSLVWTVDLAALGYDPSRVISGICSDGSNVYVATNNPMILGLIVIKLDGSGAEVTAGWPQAPFSGPYSGDIDCDGFNVFASSRSFFGPAYGFFVVSWATDGTFRWQRLVGFTNLFPPYVPHTGIVSLSASGTGGCFALTGSISTGPGFTEIDSAGSSLGFRAVTATSCKGVGGGKVLVGHADGLRYYERAGASWAGESPLWTAGGLAVHVVENAGGNPVVGGGRS